MSSLNQHINISTYTRTQWYHSTNLIALMFLILSHSPHPVVRWLADACCIPVPSRHVSNLLCNLRTMRRSDPIWRTTESLRATASCAPRKTPSKDAAD